MREFGQNLLDLAYTWNLMFVCVHVYTVSKKGNLDKFSGTYSIHEVRYLYVFRLIAAKQTVTKSFL